MKRPLLALFVLSLAAPSSAQQPQSVAQAVSAVQSFYGGVRTYNADFKQEYLIRMLNQTVTSDGTVTFQKPSKANFSYLHPPGNRVLLDNGQLLVRQASTQQTYAANQVQMPAVLSFLSGQAPFGAGFTFTFAPIACQGCYVLAGKPTTPTPYYETVLFYVDQATAQVRQVMVLDGQGNRNKFTFDHVAVNVPVPPRTFQP
jgi:outer membrane lipoprotein carrier protein